MAREIDDKKTKKALRKLRKAKLRAESEDGPGLTDWEKEFFEGVEDRLETFGSAFADPEKGNLDDALSARQTHIVREIDKKSRKKGKEMKRSSFKPKSSQSSKSSKFTPRGRDIHEDLNEEIERHTPMDQTKIPSLKLASDLISPQPHSKEKIPSPKPRRPTSPFRVIKGGKDDS